MFALLEHTTAAGRHWDLLVEVAGCERLPTWRLAACPLDAEAAGRPIAAERIADHRPLYLDFEGELSGGRGRVRRLDRGPAAVERLDGNELIVSLEGAILRGRFAVTAGRFAAMSP